MASKAFYLPYNPAFNSNGLPEPGATVSFFAPGTDTKVPIYANEGRTIELTNPVGANAAARLPAIYLDPDATYRVVIKGRHGEIFEEMDPFIPGTFPKGDPGGNIEAIGLFEAISGMNLPEGTTSFRTAGHSVLGFGDARVDEFDEGTPEANDAFVAAHPRWAAKSANGRYVRLAEPVVDPYVFGALGNPAGDGSRLDDEAHQAAVTYCAMFGATYKFRNGTFSLSEQADIPAGTESFVVEGEPGHQIRWHGATGRINTADWLAPALFGYKAQFDDPNPPQRLVFRNLFVRNMNDIASDNYVFCSTALGGTGPGGRVSGNSPARVDGLVFENCTFVDMCGVMAFGLNNQLNGNIGVNSRPTAADGSRHTGIGFNHPLLNQNADFDDTRPSSCVISGNHLIGYSNSILVHSSFNLDDNTRIRIESAHVADNWCYGGKYDAVVRGRVGIYVASVKKSFVHDNYCEYFDDLGIDLENNVDGLSHDNILYNCILGQFWDTQSTVFRNERVVITDPDWFDNAFSGRFFFKKTGSPASGRVAFIDCEFRCDLDGSTRLGIGTCTIPTRNLEITRCKFVNGSLFITTDQPIAELSVNDCKFYLTKEIDIVSPVPALEDSPGHIIFIRNSGKTEIEDCAFYSYSVDTSGEPVTNRTTPIRQTMLHGTVCVRMGAYSGTTPFVNARSLSIKRNSAIGFPVSFEVWDEGSGGNEWTVDFVDNDYDGTIVMPTPAVVRSRAFLSNNHKIWDKLEADAAGGGATAGRYTAFPKNPAEAALLGNISGTNSGASATVMTDTAAAFGDLVGKIIVNTADGSRGRVTANTATTITVAQLSGGVANAWANGDKYAVLNTAAGIQFRGGSSIPVLGTDTAGIGGVREYVMAKESGTDFQTWGAVILSAIS